jgi:lipid II:glycine glycyltransferase (peptidoglycan interpeptide bridge formation enzyme)
MSYTTYKKSMLKIGHYWFSETVDKNNRDDILFIHGSNKFIFKHSIVTKQSTLIIDLTNQIEFLYNEISKNNKYEIRRAEKESVSFKVFKNDEIYSDMKLLDEFENSYNSMYKEKGMIKTFNKKIIDKYIKNGSIIFTIGLYKNSPYVFHAYIYDELNTRLLYSVSSFRNNEEIKALIGRINKYLQWKDILLFKKMGIRNYDLGGIHDFKEPNGIDKFKMSFGGERTDYYNIITSSTILGRLLIIILKLRNKILN